MWWNSNGQWMKDGEPQGAPPPVGTTVWYQDAKGDWGTPTVYEGPQSAPAAPVNAVTPRAGRLEAGGGVPGATTPTMGGSTFTPTPTVAPGITPAPAYTGTVSNGRMSGRAYSNPDTPAPKGYNPELWDQRNIGIDRTLAAPLVTLGQNMGINTPSNTPTNLFQRQDFDAMGINENVADRNLLTSIQEVAKNGIAGSGIGKERANFILQALSNPAIVGNIARSPQNASMKMMGGAPTNLIDRAGMIFDQQNNPAPRRIPESMPAGPNNPATPMGTYPNGDVWITEDTEGLGWEPGPNDPPLPAAPPHERARVRGMGDRRAPLNMNRRNERGAPIPRMANGTITSPGMSIPEQILGAPRPMPSTGTGSVSSWPGQPAVNPPGYPNPQRTFIPPPRGQAALDRGNPMVLANPMSQMLRAMPRPARPFEASRGPAVPRPIGAPAPPMATPSVPQPQNPIQIQKSILERATLGQPLTSRDIAMARASGAPPDFIQAVTTYVAGGGWNWQRPQRPDVMVNKGGNEPGMEYMMGAPRYGGGTNLFLAPRYATGSLPIGQYVADMKQKALTTGLTRADVRDASQRFATFPQLAALLNAMNSARIDMGNPLRRTFNFDAPDIWTPVDSTPAPTPTVPTPTTPTPTPTTPTTPTPAANPQVMWYDKDAWAANPTLKYLNGQWSENMFRTPSSRASYDPATGTTIQSAGSMNAGNMMDIDRDSVRRGMTESLLTRHNRSYEKELADAIANAPMGSASRYVKTG